MCHLLLNEGFKTGRKDNQLNRLFAIAANTIF
jgi:hypothetical protein